MKPMKGYMAAVTLITGRPSKPADHERRQTMSSVLSDTARLPMQALLAVLVSIALAGCAKTTIYSEYESSQSGLQRPERILVYGFAVTRDQVKENQGLLQGAVNDFEETTTYQHEGEIADEVRAVAAEEMVKGIQNLGLPAERAAANTPVPPRALAITGQFLNVDEGNKLQRLVIGFGKGQSQVDILIQVHGYGLGRPGSLETRPTKLVEFATRADSGSMPGALVTGGAGAAAGTGAAVIVGANMAMGAAKSYRSTMEAMTGRNVEQAVAYLSEYFWRQGWIPRDKVTEAKRP